MRIARFAAVFVLLVAGPSALAEDLSGKLAELENGAKAPSDKVQIVPGVDQPQLHPTVEPSEPSTQPMPEPKAKKPKHAPKKRKEPANAEAMSGGNSESYGTGLNVDPKIQAGDEPAADDPAADEP